jgi:hypothetical protein
MNLCTGRIEYIGFFRSNQAWFGKSIYAHKMDAKECIRWYDRLIALFFGVQWKLLNIRDPNTREQKSIFVRINQLAAFLKETPENLIKMDDVDLADRFHCEHKALKKAKLTINRNKVSISLEGCKLVLQTILADLDLPDLAACSRVSKAWAIAANCPLVWKTAIYRTIACKSEYWVPQLGLDIIEEESKEFDSLPFKLVNEFKRFHRAFPNTNVSEGLALVRIPKGLTMRSIQKAKINRFNDSSVNAFLRAEPISKWILMTKQPLPDSSGISFVEQKVMIADLAKKRMRGYRVPTVLEAVAVPLAHHVCKEKYFSGWYQSTHCSEMSNGHQMSVAVAQLDGHNLPMVIYNHGSPLRGPGVAAVKDLNRKHLASN